KPEVMATLMPMMAIQPIDVCGGCQFSVPSDKATNRAVDETNEYHVDSLASAPARKARVSRRMAVRQQAAGSAKAPPAKASPAGWAPIITARPRKAKMAHKAPRQRSRSSPIADAISPGS